MQNLLLKFLEDSQLLVANQVLEVLLFGLLNSL